MCNGQADPESCADRALCDLAGSIGDAARSTCFALCDTCISTTTSTVSTTTTLNAEQLKGDDIKIAALKEQGKSAAELLSKGYTPAELHGAGYTVADLEASADLAEWNVDPEGEEHSAQMSALKASLETSSSTGAIIGALLAVIVLGVAGYFGYKKYKEQQEDAPAQAGTSAAKGRQTTARLAEQGGGRSTNSFSSPGAARKAVANPSYDESDDFDNVVQVVSRTNTGDSAPPVAARTRTNSNPTDYGFDAGKASTDGMFLDQLELDEFRSLDVNDVGLDTLPKEVRDRLKDFNRYKNILPNPHSRIILDVLGKDSTSSFINANYIPNYLNNPKGYIAAQGPKDTTLSHFWRMVWLEDCRTIVMVTGLMEGQKQKCARYWPSSLKSRVGTINYGGIEVGVIAGKHRQGYKVAELEITHAATGETRTVKHFWFDSWPDYGVPEDTMVVPAMLEEVKQWNNVDHQPWVVHCSAGIGRTGTFIGIDMGMNMLRKTGECNVIDLVEKMREGRGGMVQTAEQCEFVHKVLEDFAVTENAKLPPPVESGTQNLYGNIGGSGPPPSENLYGNITVAPRAEQQLYENVGDDELEA
jgi:protein tyrosine phosphatase